MAINKKLIHFNKREDFDKKSKATSASDTTVDILYSSIVFIKDTQEIWTHGQFYPCPYTKDEIDSNTQLVQDFIQEYKADLANLHENLVNFATEQDIKNKEIDNNKIKIENLNNIILGDYEAVDLGLSSGTLWADRNIGAVNIYEGGKLFQWADPTPYDIPKYDTNNKILPGQKQFGEEDYKYYDESNPEQFVTKYNEIDNKEFLDIEDDAAKVNMGTAWSVPTRQQVSELFSSSIIDLYANVGEDNQPVKVANGDLNKEATYINWLYIDPYTQDTVKDKLAYILFTSKINNNTLILPFFKLAMYGGMLSGNMLWLNSVELEDIGCGYCLLGAEESYGIDSFGRNIGVNVRGVTTKVNLYNHPFDTNNPHKVTKEQIGLGNVNNTSDIDKPISTAVQSALDTKADFDIVLRTSDKHMQQYVDLDLPSGLLWATKNIGATNEGDSGQYFQWGDTIGYTSNQIGTQDGKKKFSSDFSDYKYATIDEATDTPLLTKYCNDETYGTVDNQTELEQADDVASITMGGDWRTPSYEEIKELFISTDFYLELSDGTLVPAKANYQTNVTIPASAYSWEFTEPLGDRNILGIKFFSKKDNTKYLFIPSSGIAIDGQIDKGTSSEFGLGTVIWSRNIITIGPDAVWGGYFNNDIAGYEGGIYRYLGCPVRGVVPKYIQTFYTREEINAIMEDLGTVIGEITQDLSSQIAAINTRLDQLQIASNSDIDQIVNS